MVVNTESNVSRGLIPLKLLQQEQFEPILWKEIIQSFECENLNVLFGDFSDENHLKFYVYSSDTCELSLISNDQKHQIFSLTNGSVDSDWSKEKRGKELIYDSVVCDNNFTENLLFSVLT